MQIFITEYELTYQSGASLASCSKVGTTAVGWKSTVRAPVFGHSLTQTLD